MESSNYITVLITTASIQEAREIAKVLLERRKIACANLISKVESHFWWQDKLDSAEESLLIAKSKAALLPEIITLVKEAHSYQVPEIIALPIIGGSQDYLEWIEESVS
jgi:periplasmic divalent cation tolerance protein